MVILNPVASDTVWAAFVHILLRRRSPLRWDRQSPESSCAGFCRLVHPDALCVGRYDVFTGRIKRRENLANAERIPPCFRSRAVSLRLLAALLRWSLNLYVFPLSVETAGGGHSSPSYTFITQKRSNFCALHFAFLTGLRNIRELSM